MSTGSIDASDTLHAATRGEWRAWLNENHASAPEVWLVFYKKTSGKLGVSYEEAVEEALCFGWIDGKAKSLDAERWAQRFTPRRPRSNWSESNKKRVRRLIEQGLMTSAGLSRVTFPLEEMDKAADE